jgi:hypothetical protein
VCLDHLGDDRRQDIFILAALRTRSITRLFVVYNRRGVKTSNVQVAFVLDMI